MAKHSNALLPANKINKKRTERKGEISSIRYVAIPACESQKFSGNIEGEYLHEIAKKRPIPRMFEDKRLLNSHKIGPMSKQRTDFFVKHAGVERCNRLDSLLVHVSRSARHRIRAGKAHDNRERSIMPYKDKILE